ncbi:RHS repeat-associated core domain-containing protein [Acinetobacter sp. V110_1]|nr:MULTISPECIES: RHS repeat-associated core domain-containing protein [Acinetobacter]MDH2636488.1 RHS repeat-associated core domain-containing protein [Acinetobacter nosocomialis]MDS7944276.1 RHS repeat-associated core domain-containing protein [Acinetobacter sp. V110_1]
MKNNDMYSKKIWSSAIQLVLLSLILLLSQLTLAKDRIQYHIQNFDGSTLKVINEQGIVSQSYQYAPFGQQLQLKKPSNLKNPQAFVGGVQDANDLVYLKQRHYNPVLGRFYQADPVTFLEKGHGQINRYQYGWNDTYSFSDPSGLCPACVPLFVFGIWGVDNLRSDTPNKNNPPPSGIGDAAIMGYGGASLLFSARLASMSTAELTYYNIAQKGATTVSPVIWMDKSTEWVTVGRWMSVGEYNTMKLNNHVLEGAGGLTFVTQGGSKMFPSAAKGSVYAEFSVPSNSLLRGGADGWYKVVGPNAMKSQQYMIQKQGGTLLPPYRNLTPILERK